jgi:hypothetical protein
MTQITFIFFLFIFQQKNPQKLNEPKVVISNQTTQRYPNNKKVRKSNIQKHLCFCHRPVTAIFLFIISCICFVSKLFDKKNFEALRKENPDMFGKYVDNLKLLRPSQILLMPQNGKHERDFCFPILFFNSELRKMFESWIIKFSEL